MRLPRLITVLALVCAGCGTIRDARRAKDAVEPLAREGGAVPPRNTGLPALPDGKPYRLPDFVDFALTNRPDVVSARLAFADALLALDQVEADGILVPKVGVGGGFSRTTANSGRHFSMSGKSSYSGDVSLDILIYDFGRADAREKAAREEVAAAGVTLVEAERTAFKEVAVAYFESREADARLAAALTNEFLYAEHLAEAKARFEAQEVRKLDVLKAEMDYSDARLATVNASNVVKVANAAFVQALGVATEGDARLRLLPPEKDPLAGALEELPVEFATAAKLRETARRQSPDLAYRRAKLRAADAQVDYAVADLFPELSMNAAFDYAEPVWNFSWGWRVAQSLFEGYKKTTAVDRAVLALRAAAADVDAGEATLAADLGKLVAARDDAAAALVAARVKADQARENLVNVREEYRVGEASRLDFTAAVKTFSQAMGDRVCYVYRLQVAVAALTARVGADPVYTEKEITADGRAR